MHSDIMFPTPVLAAETACQSISPPRVPWGELFRLLPLRSASLPEVRSKRVTMLLAAIFAMCLSDLGMTLTYATSVGMIESNPIARAVMEHGCPEILAWWKLSTMALSTGILFWARRHKYAEGATWVCFVVMACLSVHWLNYSNEVSTFTPEFSALAMSEDPRWVNLGP